MAEDNLLNESIVENTLIPEEEVQYKSDPLTLKLDNEKAVKVVNKWIEDSHNFFKEKYNLFERRKKNETYLFGRQINEKEKKNELKIYEARYLDNAIYEIEAAIKPLAMQRLPDLIVTPGTDNPNSKETAKNVSEAVNDDLKKRENRIALSIAFKHHPVYFTGVIKARWDREKDDYIFEAIHPDYVEVDHTAQSNNADDMKWVAQTLPITIEECFIQFPSAKEELTKELQKEGLLPKNGDPTTKDLLTEIKIKEVWFDWYNEKKGKVEDEKEYEKVYGVMWKYKNCILKKIKNPNFDYEGDKKLYAYEDPSNETSKHEISPEEMQLSMMTGVMPGNMQEELVYKNYFKKPRKPFYFIGYDQWRKVAYDETSRIEQNIRNQENLDKRGKSVIDKLSQRVKHVFSKMSGLKAKDIEQMDLDDPKQDVLVDGDVRQVHSSILPEQPTAQEFQDLDNTRNRMYSTAGANAIRGEVQSDTATSNQIAREADYTRADDLVEETINAAAEWMSQWSMQFIKLRYTKDHWRKLMGSKGEITFLKLANDMIEDGMEVKIKASGTDKVRIKNQAMEMAKLKLIDPLSFYEDIGVSDPQGRVEKLLLFSTNPSMYLAQFGKNLGANTAELANTLLQQGQPLQPNNTGSEPTQQTLPQAQPTQPTVTNTSPSIAPPAQVPQGSTRML